MSVKLVKTKEPKPVSKSKTKEMSGLEDAKLRELETLFVMGFTHRIKQVHTFPDPSELIEELLYRWEEDEVPSRAKIHHIIKARGLTMKRRDYQEQLKQAERIKRLTEMSERSFAFDNECLRVAEVGVNQIKATMARTIKSEQLVSVGDLERMGKALQKFQLVGRMALGDRPDDLLDKMNTSSIDYDNLSKEELGELEKMMQKSLRSAEAAIARIADENEPEPEEGADE